MREKLPIPKENLPYRPSVGLMIINHKCEVFVGKRIDTKIEAWQMPQGGIDDDEDPDIAAFREMEEEIGSKEGIIICKSSKQYSYDLPQYLIPKLWNGKYRGQRQQWYLIKFTGEDRSINIKNNSLPEFIEWKWTKIEDLPNIIVPFKRSLYISVIEEFREELLKLKKNV